MAIPTPETTGNPVGDGTTADYVPDVTDAGSGSGALDFAALSSRSQVLRLRQVAFDALAHYPVDVARLRLVFHGHNTTFRVDTSEGISFALRINVGSNSTAANLDAETAWLAALARDTDLAVPEPQPTIDGRLHTTVGNGLLGREFPVVLMSWLPGRNLDDRAPRALAAMGRLTAVLHDHAGGWSPPAGSGFPLHRDVLVDDERHLDDDHPLLTDELRDVFDATYADTQGRLDELWVGQTARPIHADLHPGNLKWRHGRLAVFDFDDALMGIPVQDLGITAYYLGAGEHGTDLDAMFAGYEEVGRLPAFTDRQLAAIQAGRNLLLVNEMLGAVNADLVRILPVYLANARRKLVAYLETGRYRHDVPGIVPIPW